MAVRKRASDIPKHSHCIMCGAAIPETQLLCSDKCKDDYARMEKRQRNMRIAALLPIAVTAVILVVLFLLRGK